MGVEKKAKAAQLSVLSKYGVLADFSGLEEVQLDRILKGGVSVASAQQMTFASWCDRLLGTGVRVPVARFDEAVAGQTHFSRLVEVQDLARSFKARERQLQAETKAAREESAKLREELQGLLPPTAAADDALHLRVRSVAELLALKLDIPEYQRPYKWTEKHLGQLFHDFAAFESDHLYRLGTVVFHRHDEQLDIVDGQQRTLTLMLIVRALIAHRLEGLESASLRQQLTDLNDRMIDPSFTSQVSIRNLQRNYQVICRLVGSSEFTEARIEFLLNRCEVVCFALTDVSEAFQFFDSQNARGRDLEPHDLLKAYHLREFDPQDADVKAEVVAGWEDTDSEQLARLFENCLYRVRRWVKGESARYFGKEDVDLFKGVNLADEAHYPYAVPLLMTHRWVDQQNRAGREQGRETIAFPFQLDQTIINGRRFFEMAVHYQRRVVELKKLTSPDTSEVLQPQARAILETLASYKGRSRTGDRYVRGLFDCVLIYYIDAFGLEDISRVIEKAFIWAYRLRLERHAVHLATVDNHALGHNVFRVIQNLSRPQDFLAHPLPMAASVRKEPELLKLFQDMKFHE